MGLFMRGGLKRKVQFENVWTYQGDPVNEVQVEQVWTCLEDPCIMGNDPMGLPVDRQTDMTENIVFASPLVGGKIANGATFR